MKNIKIILICFLIGISALWLFADNLLPQPFNYFAFRKVMNQYSGLVAMGAMSLCMVIAVRPRWLERFTNGLDKGYRLHKWLGITALTATITHFIFTKGKKWMVGWGWLVRPERKGGGQPPVANADFSLEQWLGGMRHTAESVGEWAFYVALVLMVVALIKLIPYRWFVKFHDWLSYAYLALVFHAVVLIKFSYWTQPIGWLMAILLAMGTISAVLLITKQAGKHRRFRGTVQSMQFSETDNSLDMQLHIPQWQGHQAGQFVFVRFLKDKEKAHPFTLASAWQADTQTLRVCVKDLGDYTHTLRQHIQVGDAVEVEGAYGHFTFQDTPARQIWVATGIGVTPFMAQLQALANQSKHNQSIDFIYSYREDNPSLLAQLQQQAQQANVRLHLWHSATQGHLDTQKVMTMASDWQQASVWYCGVQAFGKALQADLQKQGLPQARFHQECFEMR